MGDVGSDWRTAFWPDVSTEAGAARATKQAFWAAVIVAVVTMFFAALSLLGLDASALIDAVLFGVIAFGLHKKLRTAAVCGLVLYGIERVYMWSTVGFTNPVVPLVLTLAFISGVRGTYAWQRLRRSAASPEPTF
jgi:hypothetical protein